jgi:hypothetical protein
VRIFKMELITFLCGFGTGSELECVETDCCELVGGVSGSSVRSTISFGRTLPEEKTTFVRDMETTLRNAYILLT